MRTYLQDAFLSEPNFLVQLPRPLVPSCRLARHFVKVKPIECLLEQPFERFGAVAFALIIERVA